MSSQSGPSGGAEQRRFARVPINLDGFLVIGSAAAVPCTVRDFCVGGMFISVAPDVLDAIGQQTAATLYFALIVGGEKKDCQVQLTVARVVAKGLGVSFVNPDPATLSLLGHLAAPEGMPTPPTDAESLESSQAGFAREYAAVQEPLLKLVQSHVEQICERFIEDVDNKLFLAARDAGNNVDETMFLDGQREVQGKQDSIRNQVPEKIALGLSILGNPLNDSDKEPDSIGLSDLSLIDKGDFEDFLAVSEMVSELEPRFSDDLFQLGRRISYLANRMVEVESLPIGPGVMCNAVADVLKGLQSDARVTRMVYRSLHHVMEGNLGAMFQEVNALLIEKGVLPVIDKDKPVIKKSSSPGGFDANVPDATESLEQELTQTEEELADLMPGPEGYTGQPAPAVHPPGTGLVQPQGPGYGQHPATGVTPAAPGVPHAPGQSPMPPAAGGIQAAPAVDPSGMQSAPPSMPPGAGYPSAGGVLQDGAPAAAPGAVSAGAGVQPAPPVAMAPGVVEGAEVAAPSGGVQAAMPEVPGQVAGAASGGPQVFDASSMTPGGGFIARGWGAAPSVQCAPAMQRAYSTAQTQLALRRELGPEGPAVVAGERYSSTQALDGLTAVQQDFAGRSDGELLDMEDVKQRITDALTADGAPQKLLGEEVGDAIEVVANLFNSLIHDNFVAKNAKSHLTRLQPSVHRAALVDQDFFESTDHPVRQVINRLSRIRDGNSAEHKERHTVVNDMISRVNREFTDDIGLFNNMVDELDGLLEGQEAEYRDKVSGVVEDCEAQQKILEQRRGQSLEATDSGVDRSDLPEEWNKWLDRSRALEVGQKVIMNANSPRATQVTLVWKEAQNNLFVFVDEQGNKASTLTLQQVAMYLRRGIIVILDEEAEQPALERAMVGVVERFHSQVEKHATEDTLTGFLLGKFFIEEIDRKLPELASSKAVNPVVSHFSIENLRAVNESLGSEAGDAFVKAIAAMLRDKIRGKQVLFGRLDGSVFGICWPTGGIESAYKKMQDIVPEIQALEVVVGDDAAGSDEAMIERTSAVDADNRVDARPEVVVGLCGSNDINIQAAGLLASAREACDSAREMGLGSIYVAGSEDERKRQLEQLVAYTEKALKRNALKLFGHRILPLSESDVRPAIYLGISAEDRNGKLIPESTFLPALARSAKAAEIDLWAFRSALRWILNHEEQAEEFALIVVPLSAASMKNEDLPNLLMGEFMETPVPPGRICFSLPDAVVVDNAVAAGELISVLNSFGCRFLLNEFGSGQDNYDYIKNVDVDFVVVQTSFISDAQKNPKDFAMAKSINELVHFMGKKTIARQSGSEGSGDTIKDIGIDFLIEHSDTLELENGDMPS